MIGEDSRQIFSPTNQQSHHDDPIQHQHQPVVSGRYAPKGTMQPDEQLQQTKPSSEDPVEVLAKLKKMLDAGLITQEQYNAKVNEVMSRM